MTVVTAVPTVRVVTAVPVIDWRYADGIVCRYCRWQGRNWRSVRGCGNGGVSHSGDRDRTCNAYHEVPPLGTRLRQDIARQMN